MKKPIRGGCIRAGYIQPAIDDFGKRHNNKFDRINIVAASQLPDRTETIFVFRSALPCYCSIAETLNTTFLSLRTSFYLIASFVTDQTSEDMIQNFNLKYDKIISDCQMGGSESAPIIPYELNTSDNLPIWQSLLNWLRKLPGNAPCKMIESGKSNLIANGCEYPSLMISSKPGLFLSFDDFGSGAITTCFDEDNPFYSICQDGKITTNQLLRPQLKFKGK